MQLSQDSIIRKSQIQGLEDSIIALSHQKDKLQEMVADGTKRWAGQTPRQALVNTCKAMLVDIGTLENAEGATEWSDKHRQAAIAVLRELE